MAKATQNSGGNHGSATQHAAGLALIGLGAALIVLSVSAMVQQNTELRAATIVPPGEFEKKIYLPGDSGRVYFEYNPVRVSEGAVQEEADGSDELVDPDLEPVEFEAPAEEPQITGALSSPTAATPTGPTSGPVSVLADASPTASELNKPAKSIQEADFANKTIQRKTLRQSQNPALQRELKRIVADLDLEDAVSEGRLGVSLVDITNPHSPQAASVNGDMMLYAASLPKIAILMAAFERIEEGRLSYTPALKKRMTAMIRHSSNREATAVLDMVGRDYVNKLLASNKYRLYDRHENGGLWVGKAYARGTAYHRDPLHNISHGATATQVARFYYLLETGQLVSKKASQEMKQILSRPAIEHKFVGGLLASSPAAKIYRKSGTWRDYHADSAIVEHKGRRYIAVALAQDSDGEDWLRDLIVAMDDAVMRSPVGTVVAAAY